MLRISPTVCLFITGLNILVSLYHHALLRSFLVKFVVIPRPVSPPCLLRFYSHPHITRSVNKSARSAPHFVCTAASKRISPLPRFSIISAFFQKASDLFPPFPSFLWHPQRDNLSPSFSILSVSEGCVWVCLQFWFMSTVLIFCSVSGVFRILPFCNKMQITLWDSFSYIHRLCQGCYY